MMPPKKPHRGKRISGKKPSPKKMIQAGTSASPTNRRRSQPRKVTITSPKAAVQQDPANETQRSTPTSENPALQSPRSNERYDLRNITPPSSYSLNVRQVSKTPLRTPSGILQRTPARERGQTPGNSLFRTPKLKSLGRERLPDRVTAFTANKEEALLWKEDLKSLTCKSYKLCYLSSMNGFKYRNNRLRRKYESHLQRRVLDVHPSAQLNVAIDTSSCLTLKPGAVDAVKIEITSLNLGDDDEEDEEVKVYYGWLFRTSKSQNIISENTEWFPVMLYTGREEVHYAVSDWLQGSFGCYVSRYGMRQNDLMWIAGVWSGRSCPVPSHKSGKHLRADFIYLLHPPHGENCFPAPNVRGKARISLGIPLECIHHIWQKVVDGSSGAMEEEELSEYFSGVEAFVSQISYIPKYLLELHQLRTPCISLRADGKIHFSCSQSISVLVNHLIDIAQQSANIYSDEENSEFQDKFDMEADEEDTNSGSAKLTVSQKKRKKIQVELLDNTPSSRRNVTVKSKT